MTEKDRKNKQLFMFGNQGAFPSSEVKWILGWPEKAAVAALLSQTMKNNNNNNNPKTNTLDHAA